ncbi:MAG TPA: B-box zinc finger protein [Terracidiphilus sp.]|jgi:TM2 domain-containing membrane protein YozV|nr:B-box zinc finger protein [Terracidiphilus sp.]
MDCVNHPGTPATAYCQNCGKAMCAACKRTGPAGQILCEPCTMSWQTMQQPFIPPPAGSPNPIAAGVLGIIPGVGAMYNGQFFKGLIHVVIFAVLISITDHYAIFGIFIAAWVVYQAFEAYHTAIARRDGLPLPDPLGLNEVGNWFNMGGRPPVAPPPGASGPAAGGYQQAPYAPYAQPAAYPPNPYEAPPYTPVGGYVDPSAPPVPPVPPVPPLYWKRREPVGAVILIGFGLILLLNQMGLMAEHVVKYLWPLIFIALGAWMIVRRFGDTKGGPQ